MKKTIWANFFKNSSKCYCYDVGTNSLLEITRVLRDCLKLYNYINREEVIEKLRSTYPAQEIVSALRAIDHFNKKKGGFVLKIERRPRFPFTRSEYEQLSKNLLNHMILNITEDCNFRCKYCVFSGHYFYSRTHQEKSMAWSTIMKSIDYLVENAEYIIKNTDRDLNLGFYGGEPLLESKKIFKAVEYIKKNYTEIFPRFKFSLTTNGSLLNEETIRKFIKHHFVLFISLNGPKEINDEWRVSSRGSGTYDLAIKQLELIKRMDERYFEENVGFSIVFVPEFRLREVTNYFRKNHSAHRLFMTSLVSMEDTNLFDSLDLAEGLKKYHSDLRKLKREYFGVKVSDKNDEVLCSLFEKPLSSLHNRSLHPLGDEVFPSGPCLPGLDKLFVDCKGNLHLCERINGNFSIGNIQEGIDVGKVFYLIDQYLASAAQCKGCWAFRLCGSCFLTAIKNDQFSRERKLASCKIERDELQTYMKDYIRIVGRNPKAFETEKKTKKEDDIFDLALEFLGRR